MSDDYTSEPNTAARWAEIRERERQNILQHGHSVTGVMGDPPFVYTVGRAFLEQPELLMTGVNPEAGAGIVNAIAELENAAKIDLAGMADRSEEVRLEPFLCPLRFIWADPKASEMNAALRITPDLRAVQVVYPDAKGHWPEDAEFEGVQPVFAR